MNLEQNFSTIIQKSKTNSVKNILETDKELIENYFGITEKSKLESLIQKLNVLKDETISINKAMIENDSIKQNSEYTSFNLILYLTDNNEISLKVSVNNYIKNSNPVLIIE